MSFALNFDQDTQKVLVVEFADLNQIRKLFAENSISFKEVTSKQQTLELLNELPYDYDFEDPDWDSSSDDWDSSSC